MKIFSQNQEYTHNKEFGTTKIVQRDDSVGDGSTERAPLRRWLTTDEEFTGFKSPPGRF